MQDKEKSAPVQRRTGKPMRGLFRDDVHVLRAQFIAVFGIGFGLKRDLLALGEGFVAVHLNGGEMHKHILSGLFAGNKAVSFFRIEPILPCRYTLRGSSLKNSGNRVANKKLTER